MLLRSVLFGIGILLTPSAFGPAAAEEAVRDVTMGRGEVRLRLPESWIDSVVGAEQDGQVLLHMRWPGLTGYHDGHERDHPEDGPAHNGLVQVLLTLRDRINPLEERYRLALRYLPALRRYPSTMGLEHWSQDAPSKRKLDTQDEVYFLPGLDGRVETFIYCNLPGMRYPDCKAEFYVGPFLAHVTYGSVFLPDWRAIEDGVREQVLSFEG